MDSIYYLQAFNRLDIFEDKEYIIELIIQLTNQVHNLPSSLINVPITNVMIL